MDLKGIKSFHEKCHDLRRFGPVNYVAPKDCYDCWLIAEVERLEGKNELLCRTIEAHKNPIVDRFKPCGCVLCICQENEENRCMGCGAMMCPTHMRSRQ